MNWGVKVTIAFICFITMIISLIVVCMKQDVFLVSEDYYKQEIAYEERITEIKNVNSLEEPLKIIQKGKELQLGFPESMNFGQLKGEVHFFRPSDARQDKKVSLSLNKQGEQHIDLSKMPAGYWKLKISWKDADKSYFKEKALYL